MAHQTGDRRSEKTRKRLHLTLGELAERIGAVVEGDAGLEVHGIRPLDAAGPGDLSFLHTAAYLGRAADSDAAALIVPEALAAEAAKLERPLVVAGEVFGGNSQLALARALAVLYPDPGPGPGIHPTAVVAPDALVDPTAHLGAYVVVGEGSRIGTGCWIEAHTVIGRRCTLGTEVRLHPGVVLYDDTVLGDRVEVHSGAVLGADGFGYATALSAHHKIPQVGRVVLGDDVEVGANSAIDRALLEATRIGSGTKIDNLVQVGHNVETGQGCILCGQVGIAGSARLGDFVVLGGQAGVIDHLKLGNGVQAAAKSAAFADIEAGTQVGGVPAVDLRTYRRQVASLQRLPELGRRLRRLEKQLEALQAEPPDAD
ncbi:MAG: UDP-3-O-(3-hydroxymyristoyl)glucosamine N-acyltransferase [Holophagales bacterium]|nr:UDP-3-O-(3-hydroxymyristoyl)glucosamine N-acyltransferase [Holophagales bacterium]